jgi:hypothetical protein
LENSEDCRSAGGHGNQHVRLRGASIDASKRSARLQQRLVATGRASCPIPGKFFTSCIKSKAWILPTLTRIPCRGPPERRCPLIPFCPTCFRGSPPIPASC